MTTLIDRITDALSGHGFIHLDAPGLQALVRWEPAMWAAFARSWDRLGPDLYMADGGRYRRRRHGAFAVRDGMVVRKPHQPHFQSRDYNPLNGDVQRWFEPIEAATADGGVIAAIFRACTPLFEALDGGAPAGGWHCEVHQFRIEASADEQGRPTPEGLHRDGVDWVLVLLVAREGVEQGVTEIGDAAGQPLGRFTLRAPGDAVLLDDRRIRHGVTPIRVSTGAGVGHRDALVVTWRAEASS